MTKDEDDWKGMVMLDLLQYLRDNKIPEQVRDDQGGMPNVAGRCP